MRLVELLCKVINSAQRPYKNIFQVKDGNSFHVPHFNKGITHSKLIIHAVPFCNVQSTDIGIYRFHIKYIVKESEQQQRAILL